MKSKLNIYAAVAWMAVVHCGCASAGENLSEAGIRLHAAFKACIKEKLSRENAVEQSDCMGKALIQAGYENYQEYKPGAIEEAVYMQSIEQDVVADLASAIEYAEGKIDKKIYIAAIKKHWANTLKLNKEEVEKDSSEYIDNS